MSKILQSVRLKIAKQTAHRTKAT